MQILILGGGYAGVRLALDLDNQLAKRHPEVTITLVDQHSYHQVIQVLHHVATASAGAEETIIDLGGLFMGRSVRFVQGRIERIDALQRCVALADGTSLEYDTLVLALGEVPNYWGIEGAREHTLPLRSYDDALHIRDHIGAQVLAAAKTTDPKERRVLMTCAIVGGGYTGCQLAGELSAWLPRLAKEHGLPPADVRVAIVDHADMLLRQLGAWANREAIRTLDKRGVSIYLKTHVDRVEPGALYVSGKRVLRAGTLIWAAGFRAPDLLSDSGLVTDEVGRVRVDRYLRVVDQAHIFALGDCAHVLDWRGDALPATASYAMRQGTHLAESLIALVEGRVLRTYEPLKLGEVVSLGPGEAVGDPLGLPVTGSAAAMLKKSIEAWYRSTLV